MSNSSNQGQLFLDAGDETESFIQFVNDKLDETSKAEIQVRRLQHKTDMASEPITIAVIFIGGTAVVAVARALEKWIEIKREEGFRRDLRAAWVQDPELGKTMANLEKTHSGVVVSQGMPELKVPDGASWSGVSEH